MAIARDLLTKKPLATVVSIKYDMQLGHYMNRLMQRLHRYSQRQQEASSRCSR